MAEDRNLTCRDCGKTFVFTAGEQAFFEEKGLSAPIRCPDCRRLRKQQRSMESPSAPGGNFAPRTSGAPPRSGEDRFNGGSDRSSAPPRNQDFTPRAPRADFGGGGDDDDRRGPKKVRTFSTAKYMPPKKEQAAVPKEKRPNNRRDEEKLLINWKEEAGLDDLDTETDWLSFADDETEE